LLPEFSIKAATTYHQPKELEAWAAFVYFADEMVNDPNEQPVNDVEGIEVQLYPNEQLDSDVETIETVAV
jgi:hypothetical protein